MKKALIITAVVIAAVLVIGAAGFLLLSHSSKNALASLVYEEIDLSRAADGTFEGAADTGLVSVRVSVTVHSHAISSIDIIEHKNGRGQAAEAITQDMKAANTWDVDAVSGATLSSETIKSAVSKALKASCSE